MNYNREFLCLHSSSINEKQRKIQNCKKLFYTQKNTVQATPVNFMDNPVLFYTPCHQAVLLKEKAFYKY